jgi:hypothetical protein
MTSKLAPLGAMAIFVLSSNCGRVSTGQESGVLTLSDYAGARDSSSLSCGRRAIMESDWFAIYHPLVVSESKAPKALAAKALVENGLSSVPRQILKTFSQMGGKVILTENVDRYCGGKNGNHKQSQLGACFRIEIEAHEQEHLAIYLDSRSQVNIARNLLPAFGFWVGQYLGRMNIGKDRSFYLDEEMGGFFASQRRNLASAFIKDLSVFDPELLKQFQNVWGPENTMRVLSNVHHGSRYDLNLEISKAQADRFEGYVFAHAFDSYHCTNEANGSNGSLALDSGQPLTSRELMQARFGESHGQFVKINGNLIYSLGRVKYQPASKGSGKSSAQEQSSQNDMPHRKALSLTGFESQGQPDSANATPLITSPSELRATEPITVDIYTNDPDTQFIQNNPSDNQLITTIHVQNQNDTPPVDSSQGSGGSQNPIEPDPTDPIANDPVEPAEPGLPNVPGSSNPGGANDQTNPDPKGSTTQDQAGGVSSQNPVANPTSSNSGTIIGGTTSQPIIINGNVNINTINIILGNDATTNDNNSNSNPRPTNADPQDGTGSKNPTQNDDPQWPGNRPDPYGNGQVWPDGSSNPALNGRYNDYYEMPYAPNFCYGGFANYRGGFQGGYWD